MRQLNWYSPSLGMTLCTFCASNRTGILTFLWAMPELAPLDCQYHLYLVILLEEPFLQHKLEYQGAFDYLETVASSLFVS